MAQVNRVTPSKDTLAALAAFIAEHLVVKPNQRGDRDYVTISVDEAEIDGITGRLNVVWMGLTETAGRSERRMATIAKTVSKLSADEKAALLEELTK
jgi:hypothetical protein